MSANNAARRWALIYNPTAGSYRAAVLHALVEALAAAGIEALPLPTAAPGHATAVAREVQGVECVAVLGGDGTLREAAQGLLGRALPLAFLPSGTANVMAHELGLPHEPLDALRVLLAGKEIALHPGLVNGRPFLLMAGFGYDGRVVHRISPRVKAWSGKGAYLLSGVLSLLGPLPRLRVELPPHVLQALATRGHGPDGHWPGGHWIVAARAQRYGGAHVIHPWAGLQQGALGLVAVERRKLVHVLVGRLGLGWGLAQRGSAGGVTVLESPSLIVRSEQPVHVQVDGDYFGQGTEFEVRIATAAVRMRVPQGWSGGS